MAQTTDAMSWVDCDVEFSTNGSDWTEASGETASVAISGGERDHGAQKTHDGDVPIVAKGKRNEMQVTVIGMFTDASGIVEEAEDAYENGTDLYFRWLPEGKTVGNKQYTTSKGIVKAPPFAVGSAESGDIVSVACTIVCAQVTPGTYSTT